VGSSVWPVKKAEHPLSFSPGLPIPDAGLEILKDPPQSHFTQTPYFSRTMGNRIDVLL
jgi:hypothetical protein